MSDEQQHEHPGPEWVCGPPRTGFESESVWVHPVLGLAVYLDGGEIGVRSLHQDIGYRMRGMSAPAACRAIHAAVCGHDQ